MYTLKSAAMDAFEGRYAFFVFLFGLRSRMFLTNYSNSNQAGSQATQLLEDLLKNDSGSSRLPAHSSASKLQPYEISSDSLPSSRTSNSLPQYHFHGLASTQTQSQHYGEEAGFNEGSQKENIDAGKSSKEWANQQPIPRPNSPHPPVASVLPPKGDSHGNSLPRNDKVRIPRPLLFNTHSAAG